MIEMIIKAAEQDIPADKLNALAAKAGYPPATFQKLFRRHVGLSPATFRRYLDFSKASDFLLSGIPTLQATQEAGFSGNGRLHDICLDIQASTPGQLAKRGEGLHIRHGTIYTPFGLLCVGLSQHGLCWSGFQTAPKDNTSYNAMKNFWKQASFSKASAQELNNIQKQIETLWLHAVSGRHVRHASPLKLYLEGSNFQIKVWQALLQIPSGQSVHYGAIGEYLGTPDASRAVGGAVGANPLSWIIPCHRVIQKSGIVHNYAWGNTRKKALLAMENAERLTADTTGIARLDKDIKSIART